MNENSCLLVSGGGANNIVALGTLHAQNMDSVRYEYYAGVSSGSLIAFLLYLGFNSCDILNKLCTSKILQLVSFNADNLRTKGCIISYKTVIEKFVEMDSRMLDTLDKHPKYFTFAYEWCPTTGEGCKHILSHKTFPKMSVADAIYASSRIPMLLEARISKSVPNLYFWYDGGIVSNSPIIDTMDYIPTLKTLTCVNVDQVKSHTSSIFDTLTLLSIPIVEHVKFERRLFSRLFPNCTLRFVQLKTASNFIPLKADKNHLLSLFLTGVLQNQLSEKLTGFPA